MASDKDQSQDVTLRPPQPSVEVRPEVGPETAFDTAFNTPAAVRGMLPPPDGMPPAARAAEILNAAAEVPDVMARAQISVALQRTVGNARMAAMFQTAPAQTVPEPKAPPPAPPQIAVAPQSPAPQPAAAPPAETAARPVTTTATPVTTTAHTTTTPTTVTPAPAAPAKPPTEKASTSMTAPAPAEKAAAGKGAKEAEAPAGAAAAEPATAAPAATGPSKPTPAMPSEAASARAGKAAAGKAGAPAEAAGEEGGAAGAAGGAEVKLRMPEPPADITPRTRQRIGKVKAAAGQAVVAHTDLPKADVTTQQAREAVTKPQEEVDAVAQQKLVEELNKRAKPSPKIEELCQKIYKVIREKRPADEDDLTSAKPEEMAQAAGEKVQGSVEGDVKGVDQSYDELDQPPAGQKGPDGKPLEPPPESVAAPPVNATQATPDAVPAENVSLDADIEDNKARMAQAGMETEPAKLAQTGPVAEARGALGEMEETAKTDPAKVMAEQKAALSKANSDMAALQQRSLSILANSRRKTITDTAGGQREMVGSEAKMREAASRDAKEIFSKAQSDVNEQLKDLPKTAMEQWTQGVNKASLEFKAQLKEVQDWIDERHSGVGGKFLAFGDWLTGLPGWVVRAYDRAERKFGDDVCALARTISTDVNRVIAACELTIADARLRIDGIFKSLPESLQSWAEGEKKKFGSQLDGLEKRAHNVRDNFDKELVTRASQAVQDVRVQIQELRQKAGGLAGRIADAVNRFLDDPVKFIIEALLDLLSIPRAAFWAVVAKIKKVIGDIADDPEKFANNLMDAVGKGFSQFFDRIDEHILAGFIDWLTGGLAAAGVELPHDFSLKSLVTFFLQLMGITWPRIRKLLAKHIGEENVALIEKAYSIVANLIALGPEGIFEMLKEKLDPQTILDQIIKAAVDYMIKAVVKAVSARILLLFNPVGAILQAIEGIYRVLKWIFTNAARIFRLIETIVDGIADIIAGNIGAMANAVEKALAGLIPPVIDFLAEYLGFGDLPDKVRDTILSFQGWVEGILDSVIGWLVEKGKALLAAVGLGGKEEKKPGGEADKQIGKTVNFTAGRESHKLWIVNNGNNAVVMMSSEEKPVSEQLDEYQRLTEPLEPEKREKVTSLIAQARQLLTSTDASADKLAADVANPEVKPEQIKSEDDAVEGAEDQLVAVLKQIQEELGLRMSPDEVKAKVKEEVTALPGEMASIDALSGALGKIFAKYEPKGLKSLYLKEAGDKVDILASASASVIVGQVLALHKNSESGGTFLIVQLNDVSLGDDGEEMVIWNDGNGGAHAEEKFEKRFPKIVENFQERYPNSPIRKVDVAIRYTPCLGRCTPTLLKLVNKYPNFKWNIYYVELYESKRLKHTLEDAIRAINLLTHANIVVLNIEQAARIEQTRFDKK